MDRVTKGVRELPSSVSSAATFVPSRQSIMSFSLMVGSGVFFIMMAFTVFLPMIIVAPQKFAICFTLGCIFIMGAFFALKGPKSQALHMISKEVKIQSHFQIHLFSYCENERRVLHLLLCLQLGLFTHEGQSFWTNRTNFMCISVTICVSVIVA